MDEATYYTTWRCGNCGEEAKCNMQASKTRGTGSCYWCGHRLPVFRIRNESPQADPAVDQDVEHGHHRPRRGRCSR